MKEEKNHVKLVIHQAALCDVRAKVRVYLLNECGVNHYPDDHNNKNHHHNNHNHHNYKQMTAQQNNTTANNNTTTNTTASKNGQELKRSASVKLKQKKRLNELKVNFCKNFSDLIQRTNNNLQSSVIYPQILIRMDNNWYFE